MPRVKKTPSDATDRVITADDIRIAMNRLSLRIVRESDQSMCNQLEVEYQAMASRLPPPKPTPVRQPYVEELIIIPPSPPKAPRRRKT